MKNGFLEEVGAGNSRRTSVGKRGEPSGTERVQMDWKKNGKISRNIGIPSSVL